MTGLFFGSFNPIHKGHLQIARYLLDDQLVDRVLFVVSPQNPFKKEESLLNAEKRIEIATKAVAGNARMGISDIELSMPRPSYTVDTLRRFSILCPGERFALIMGEDNLKNFPLWKGYEIIRRDYPVFVYPRNGSSMQPAGDSRIHFIKAPLFPVSSTEIREKIARGEDILPFVPEKVHDLILTYYQTT
ncbi:MAG: nicotinate-nucleotide adenylyltransferase [Odoribacter sp.]|nr:nicotinate-nucleotide adenylyltransferase [Odoribacter sp.]